MAKKEKIIRNFIYILLFILLSRISFANPQSMSDNHCYCDTQHKNYFYYTPEINYNIGKNWANGIMISYLIRSSIPKFTYIEFDINSTRIGSSLFSNKVNQFFFTIGIKRHLYNYKYFNFDASFKFGYLNSENVIITSTNNNLILSPEINITYIKLNLNIGYNIFNKNNVNKNLAPFYVSLGFTKQLYFYCDNFKGGFWFR